MINDFAWEYLYDGRDTDETADAVVVSDQAGVLLATYMRGWNITFSSSSDNGASWSEPIFVSGPLQADKNWISVSPVNQMDLFVTFNSQWPYEVHSKDKGETWSDPQKLDEIEGTYFFACGSVVRGDGTAFIAYAAVRDGNTTNPFSYVRIYSSNNYFNTFTIHEIDYWEGHQTCPEWADCGEDYLNGGCSLGVDTGGNVYFVYHAYPNHGNMSSSDNMDVFLSTMLSGSSVFSSPIVVSDFSQSTLIYAGFPMVAGGTSPGDVRLAWMDNRTGYWNLYYRESNDYFASSEPSVRLSNYDKFSFQSAAGFVFPYGDYGMLLVDRFGNSHVTWGEGLGHYAGGTVMYATTASYSSSDGDANDEDWKLAYGTAVAISCVFSFVGGLLVAIFVTYIHQRHMRAAAVDDKRGLLSINQSRA